MEWKGMAGNIRAEFGRVLSPIAMRGLFIENPQTFLNMEHTLIHDSYHIYWLFFVGSWCLSGMTCWMSSCLPVLSSK
jgi:hypothetical protein